MTTVVSLANMPTSPTDVAINFLDQSKLIRRSGSLNQDGSFTAEYVYSDGNPLTETTLSVRTAPDVKNNVVRHSFRLRTVQTVTVDSIETESAPVEVMINVNVPGVMEDTAKVLSMIGTAFSLTFDGVTTKVPNAGIIDALNRGLIQDLY